MIGELDRRASLLQKTRNDDGGGGYDESWTVLATVWVSLTAAGGSDGFGPDANESRGKYRIGLRRRDDVAAGMRIAIGTRSFDVVLVQDEGARMPIMTLTCEEVP